MSESAHALASCLSSGDRAGAADALDRMRAELALYPYAHQHELMRLGLPTPFDYCRRMVADMLSTDRSYDSLPNFSAADVVRLLRVGRNEYIAAMNALKSSAPARRAATRDDALPSRAPLDLPIDHWWLVHSRLSPAELRAAEEARKADADDQEETWATNVLAECTEDELAALEVLVSAGVKRAGELSYAAVHSLYARGAIFVTVPIAPADRIAVPRLEGFVMNRTGDEPMEQALYQIFLSTNERTPISELAELLAIPLHSALATVAIGCQLGYFKNRTAPALDAESASVRWHASWLERAVAAGDAPGGGGGDGGSARGRVALLVDSKLAACLMMANLSAEIVQHAVTLYEAGKMPDETLSDFLAAADGVRLPTEADSSLRDYYEHVLALRDAVRFLRRAGGGRAVDVVRSESLLALEPATRARLLRHAYAVLVSMAPVASRTEQLLTLQPPHFGPLSELALSPWATLFLAHRAGCGPRALLLTRGTRVRAPPRLLRTSHACVRMWDGFSQPAARGGGGGAAVVPKESLLLELNAALLLGPVLLTEHEPATLEDVLLPVDPASAAAGSAEHAALSTVQALGLSLAIGSLQMLKLDASDDTAVAGGGEPQPGQAWVPFELSLGLPLYTTEACARVCANVEAGGLLEPERVAEYAAQAAALEAALRAFAEQLVSSSELALGASPDAPPALADAPLADAQPVPMPRRPICFDGRRVRELDLDSDM